MDHAEDAKSNNPAMGEDHHSQEHENPPPPPPTNRLEAAMTLLMANQNALMQAQLGGRVDGPSILDHFRRLYTSEFGGSTVRESECADASAAGRESGRTEYI